MKVVTFQNTQGVEVQYVCADLTDRIIAFAIDTVMVFVAILILEFLISGANELANHIFTFLLILPLAFFYNLVLELFNDGQSLGKKIVGIKVVRVDGMPVQTNDLLMRWMFRLVDIAITFGGLAIVFIGITPRSQRLGDLLADTTVIKIRQRKTSLDRVQSLVNLSKHKPVYLTKATFSEDQMLLMKETFDRVSNYKSPENQALLAYIANNVAASIGIPTPDNHKEFLMQVIKDYVALTR